jgi:hypothetical protein
MRQPWGADLDFTVDYVTGEGDRAIENTALLRWDSATDKLRVLSEAGRK